MKIGNLRYIALYPPPFDSLSKSLVDLLGEGGHIFPSPLMGEGRVRMSIPFPQAPFDKLRSIRLFEANGGNPIFTAMIIIWLET
jgi:hypothetical protein